MSPLVDIRNLVVGFPDGPVVRGLDLAIHPGEAVALVGESGSGKSVTARSLVGLVGQGATVSADRFQIGGADVLGFRERDWRALRGRTIGFVLQDALVSLDPLRRVGQQLRDASRGRASGADGAALLRSVGIRDPDRRLRQYPHQLSGGLRQRALIATAIAQGPALVVADEPTTALDATVQRQILDLLRERRRAGHALLLISHDLAVVADLADRVLVMRDGEVMEQGPTTRILRAPAHPYTRRLLDAIPSARTRGLRLAGGDPLPPKRVDPQRTVLEAEQLVKRYGRDGAPAVDGVSFTLAAGEALGLVGESGSGKTTVARMVLGLVAPDGGRVRLDGQPWSELPEARRRSRRAGIQFIAQDALSSFDPRFDVGRVVGESLDAVGVFGAERQRRVLEVLDAVRLGPGVLHRHPRELSGGQRQRVAIARAFAPRPRLLVADEPVSALDVSIQAQILDLLAELQAASGVALLFISHDLGVVQHLTDRVVVMRDGRAVEAGDAASVFARPRHPYTQALLQAVPDFAPARPPQELAREPAPRNPALERSAP